MRGKTDNSTLGRRRFLIGTAALIAGLPIEVRADRISPRVPRTHGPSTRRVLPLVTGHEPGTIIISNSRRTLDLVLDEGRVARYIIAIGREGFTWTGETVIGRKVEWPSWRPPAEMRKRAPDLPEMVPPGPYNPLGARALYLFRNGRDTLYRIHGTNDVSTVGGFETSGCFRLTNTDILELFSSVPNGTRVIVKD